AIPLHASPARRAWRRFRANRLGYVSLIVFAVLFGLGLVGEFVSNDKPLVARYNGHWYFPVVETLSETTFGGDFPTPADYLDPFIREQFAKPGNFALYPLNHYHHSTINYFAKNPDPSPPNRENWLGTDDRGRDLLARLLYGFRLSVVFALIVAALSTAFGVLYGAIQGYLAGWTDIGMERAKEIWGAMPVLYMLIIFDFLHLGMPLGTPSLGELLSQGKDNLYAWWISVSTFAVLVVMLLLLILIGDALRDALDPRKLLEGEQR